MFSCATSATMLINKARAQLPKLRSALVRSATRPLSVANDDEENISANYQDIPNKEPYYPPPPEPFVSVWGDKPDCCPDDCNTSTRHDVLYLRNTPPKRYTRTWVEPEPLKAKAKHCGKVMEPEYHIRSRKVKKTDPKAPCVGDQNKLGLMQCLPPPKLEGPCSKIRLPGCKLPRLPPKCIVKVSNVCCQKRCTLYPSYSECNMPKPPVRAPTECFCNKVPSNCEIFAIFKKFPVK